MQRTQKARRTSLVTAHEQAHPPDGFSVQMIDAPQMSYTLCTTLSMACPARRWYLRIMLFSGTGCWVPSGGAGSPPIVLVDTSSISKTSMWGVQGWGYRDKQSYASIIKNQQQTTGAWQKRESERLVNVPANSIERFWLSSGSSASKAGPGRGRWCEWLISLMLAPLRFARLQ